MKLRPAFTLLELVVALAVGALCMLMIGSVTASITLGVRLTSAESHTHARNMQARRWLRSAVASSSSASEETPFVGLSEAVTFDASLRNGAEGFIPCRLTIRAEGGRLVVDLGQTAFDLAEGVSRLDLDYLLRPGLNASFAREFRSVAANPAAIRFRISWHKSSGATRVDTLLVAMSNK